MVRHRRRTLGARGEIPSLPRCFRQLAVKAWPQDAVFRDGHQAAAHCLVHQPGAVCTPNLRMTAVRWSRIACSDIRCVRAALLSSHPSPITAKTRSSSGESNPRSDSGPTGGDQSSEMPRRK